MQKERMAKIAEDVVALFHCCEEQVKDIPLRSIKVTLPKDCSPDDADAIAMLIMANFPQYKVHSKNDGKDLAIGHP